MVKMENKSIAILSGIFLLGAIGAFLIIPMSFQDTIILTTKNGGGPVSCLNDGALILPQNLTDLCDVTIINATNNEILRYNGTQWVNVDADSLDIEIECDSVGNGIIICADNLMGNEIELRSLLNGTGISITNSTDEITITNTAPENTVCDNDTASGSFPLCVNNDITLRSLLAGTGISLSSNSTHITITNTAPDNTACANVGGGSEVYKDGECNFRTLISGDTNTLTYTQNTNDITINPTLKRLCEATASGGESTLTCTFSTSAQHFWINAEASYDTDATTVFRLRFNGDSGNNYAQRVSVNGGADATSGSINGIIIIPSASATSTPFFFDNECNNIASGLEKYCWGNRYTSTAGAGNAPSRAEFTWKWANTANNISSVSIERSAGTGVLQAGNTISVWGYS